MSEVFDYSPSLAGRPVDVTATGGAVTKLDIYPTPARNGVPTVEALNPTRNSDGSWRFIYSAPAQANRYYAAVTWTPSSGAAAVTDNSIVLDLPTRYDLIISCEQVAIRLGVPLPLTDTQRARIEQEIEQVQIDISNYINRPVFATFDTVYSYLPVLGYPLTDYRAFPQLLDLYNDRVTILAARDNGAGSYDLDVMIGIDGRNEPAAVRYALASAAEGIRHDPAAGMGKREVSNLSAEGQSISYKDSTATATDAGGVPNLDSLTSLKRQSVYRSRRLPDPPFPYRTTTRRFY